MPRSTASPSTPSPTGRALPSTAGTAGAAVLAAVAPPAAARPGTGGPIRRIPLQGAVNVRDLGGRPTRDGARVRHGLVYRGDHLGKLTDADLLTLAGLGLARAVDLRIPTEVGHDGADRLPAGVAAVSRPVTDNGLFGQLTAAIGSRDPVRQEQMPGGGRAAVFMADVYRTFVTDAANRAAFGRTLRELAAPGSGPALHHCTSGKDRTGWASRLLLRLVGVPERFATEDYLASNAFRAAHDARVREGLRQDGLMRDPEPIVPLQEVRREYLDAALAEVGAGYGGLYRYVTAGLGLDPRALAALRKRLVRLTRGAARPERGPRPPAHDEDEGASAVHRDAVEDHRQVLAGDLLGAVPAARPVPGGRDPDGVPDEAVREPDVQVAAEHPVRHAPLQGAEPRLLEPALRVREVVEAGQVHQVAGLLLVDGDGGAVPVDLPEGLGDEGLDGLPGAETGGEDGVVPLPQLGEEGGEDLVEHRLLGVEVVVEAAGKHAGGVRDLADGGGVVPLGGEHLGGGVEEFPAPLGRGCGHLVLLLGR